MRLLTRSDFDGICCAVLLFELGVVDEMVYAHPKDLQDGKIEVTSNDVLANVPYVDGAGLWFDHHSSEEERLNMVHFKGNSEEAPSTARVIYDYYMGDERLEKFEEMLKYVDKVDSADLTEDEILNPSGWVLLGFICDPRTGLGYHQEYSKSNLLLMQELVDSIRTKGIEEILALPDVRERIDRYFENDHKYSDFLKEHSRTDGSVVVLDTRGIDEIPPGNRFLIYSLYPDANISVHSLKVKGGEAVSVTVGHSITNRTSEVDVGSLMLSYGGGGHTKVGTCQVTNADADRIIEEIIEVCKS
jgi:oligoribonuclease NrnB/cAMP/cGMP phosphodiesterase (DHH superfamily)